MLKPGDRGDVVTVVTNTLQRLGFLAEPTDHFSGVVQSAVQAFQQTRGLTVTGVIDTATEIALEEARWKLGDRSLSLSAPYLRGDDVATLQSRLVEMGFNPGRVDGIYGPLTERAVRDFQKSVGVVVDGICGPGTVISLMRLMRTVTGGTPIELRAQASREKRGPALADKVVVLDPCGDSSVFPITSDLVSKIEGRLIALGVSVLTTHVAGAAVSERDRIEKINQSDADLVIAIDMDRYPNEKAHGVATFFYGSDPHGVHSLVGERFATLVQREICARTDLLNNRTHAKTWDILRLTKAPAVLIELGYITNPHDSQRLSDSQFRDTLAEGLVIAIQRLYLSAQEDAKTGTLRVADLRKTGIRR